MDSAHETKAAAGMKPVAKVLDPEAEAERKLIRRMQLMLSLVTQTIAQDSSLTIEDAAQMVADARAAALHMFPGKEQAFDLIWMPRLKRVMRERFHSIN